MIFEAMEHRPEEKHFVPRLMAWKLMQQFRHLFGSQSPTELRSHDATPI